MWASAGEGPGVVEDVGEAVVGMGKGTMDVEAEADGGTEDVGAEEAGGAADAVTGVDGLAMASPSSPRRRLVPRDVLSLSPRDVALIRI